MFPRRPLFARIAAGFGIALTGISPPAKALGESRRLVVQELPVAGFTQHDAPRLWNHLAIGDAVVLKRERQSKQDAGSVLVKYQGRTLGYLPQEDSSVVAAMLDRGERLAANIVALKHSLDPFQRVRVAVFAELGG